MTELHPSWHTNEIEAQSVQKRFTSRVPVNKFAPVSRMPGAILGVLFVILAGAIYTQGFGNIRSQLLGDEAEVSALPGVIHLTTSGPSPEQLHAQPGQTLTLINDQDASQILISDSLLDSTGTAMNLAVQPRESKEFTISVSQTEGSFLYGSLTSQAIRGTIIVEGPVFVAPPVSSSLPSGDDLMIGGTLPGASESSSVQSVPSQDTLIPRNPYTVARHLQRPLDQSGQPWPPPASSSFHGGAPVAPTTPQPMRQPESGPALWITFALAGAFVLFLAKRSSRYEI